MTLHIIGAGLAGLSTALEAADAGLHVVLHEATTHAGGRCRSWSDPTLGAILDNGTHMVVGANRSVFRFLARVGTTDSMRSCPHPLPMVDLASGARWNASPLALLPSILAALPRLALTGEETIAARLGRSGHFRRFWEPMAVSIMNTPAEVASARVFRAVLARTVWRSQAACRPFLAREGLSRSFIEPGLAALESAGVELRLGHALRALGQENGRARSLHFDNETVSLARNDRLVLALPWSVAIKFLPFLPALPASPIVNAHFRLAGPVPNLPPDGVMGVVGGEAHWLFLRGPILSVTVSAASGLTERSVDVVSERLWSDCAQALGLKGDPVAVKIVKEKRATLFHTPEVERLRPHPKVSDNLFLAGDWTATGLPCTLEGSILSGRRATAEVLRSLGHPSP